MGTSWVSVDSGNFDGESLLATDIKIGEKREGKVIEVSPSSKYPNAYFLTLENAEGGLTRIFTAGNLSYKCKDGKLKAGYIVQLTREVDTPPTKKGNKPRTTFTVLVDSESKAAVDNLPNVG